MTPSQTDTAPTAPDASHVISVDAMGGDKGPATVVAGLSMFLRNFPQARAILHGPEDELRKLLERRGISDRVKIQHAEDVVQMTDKPSNVLRHGKKTSMWSAVEAVRNEEAGVCVSCGNTGGLMAISMMRLRKAEGVNRPAIACLWPSRNKQGFNVMLDAGADIRADQDDLLTYALMGASYARNAFDLERPRIGLLNVGVEEHKGRAELKVAHDLIGRSADRGEFDYVGFVEGGDMPSDKIDVIVTDGFTGNVALKTGEGTATLISEFLRSALMRNPVSMFGAVLARGSLDRLRKRIDPRSVNGGVFLGLNKTVVKSHGGADATGISAALQLAYRLAQSGFSNKLAARVASAASLAQDAIQEGEAAKAAEAGK
ncbi:phosphate:acyl-[acyl carrier protein] acyltransferase [Cognatiyoonia sediminum]|uniref:Phosphate acyltransferase n=1 Tax=Cognatiyoonia sediminum TaxID=1508389 RepID=A0A1M5MG03_9RHOB|nr:phosphate acyltransferase PlsX [Cognatiyoonia sediminum]SHG76176.1 phosphate:acyl-[acyl carrier protein] acyltransferase [Cognatiyoonia sediminum]